MSNAELPGHEKNDQVINMPSCVKTAGKSICHLLKHIMTARRLNMTSQGLATGVTPCLHEEEVFERVLCSTCVNSKFDIAAML